MKKLQDNIKIFCEENKLDLSVEHRVVDLMSEVGELSKEILLSTSYGKSKFRSTDNLKNELGDVFYSLIVLANYFDIDMEEILYKTLDKYKKRVKNKSDLGSG
ncbi:MAG: nucleotide pyrophosphohydrolase [Candidatus Komeilibacteria bacterium]|jgi:NTP pyrophosphatase (non-canonical NTP hydrolase)|nr:nucleotide pyrophosphohydrolase [Candidatus Komeilibacteria bacterium]MBT4447870.1 nucleotide pyrophosphohydrolase [Candidatus Komeilibacteria bacterium]